MMHTMMMKRGFESLSKKPLERGYHCFSSSSTSSSSRFKGKGSIPTLLQPRVLVYDAVSSACHRGVKWVIKSDKQELIKFCCVLSDIADLYLRVCGLEREDVFSRMLFVEGLNSHCQGSTAALRVLSYLPIPYSALSSLRAIPTPLRDAVYDCIAKRRIEWFGNAEELLILRERELLSRFVDKEELMSKAHGL